MFNLEFEVGWGHCPPGPQVAMTTPQVAMTQNCLKKEMLRVIMRKEKLLYNLYLQLRSTTAKFLFHQKYYIETLQAMEIQLLKRCVKKIFSSDLDKFKLGTQIKTWKNTVDEKQNGIKEAIKITLSLNASRKLLVSEVLSQHYTNVSVKDRAQRCATSKLTCDYQ